MADTDTSTQPTLDQLAEQATTKKEALIAGVCEAIEAAYKFGYEAATQALREQVAQLQDALKRSNKSACDEIALSTRLGVDAERLRQQLAQVTTDLNEARMVVRELTARLGVAREVYAFDQGDDPSQQDG